MTSKKIPITAIVLTLNEEKNLPQCLDSIADYVDQIVLIDSYSTDSTLELARTYTPFVYQNTFVNQSKQFIWAIENAEIRNEWILRIDADERWTTEGLNQLSEIIDSNQYDGIYVRMQIFFMGKFLKHGGMYPNQFLRVYRKSKGRMEERWMDEHIQVDGNVCDSDINVIESNFDRQCDIGLWVTKHNNYATREAVEFLTDKYRLLEIDTIGRFLGTKVERKRWLKDKLYFKFPLFVRPFMYFFYRYIFQLGFLDGQRGFLFSVHHAFWYRFLVDTKVFQIERLAKTENISIRDAINQYSGINLE